MSQIMHDFMHDFMQHLCNIFFHFFIIGIVNHFTLFYVFVIFNPDKPLKTVPICLKLWVSLRFCNKSGVWFYIFVRSNSPFLAEDYATLSERLCNIYASFYAWILPPRCTQSCTIHNRKINWILFTIINDNALFISLSGFTAKSRCISSIITRCMIKYISTHKPMHKVTYGSCLLYYAGLLFATEDRHYAADLLWLSWLVIIYSIRARINLIYREGKISVHEGNQ